jgi:drug/metabolite transporter (DMT)-like permease
MQETPAVVAPKAGSVGEHRISRRLALLFALTTAALWGTAYVAAKFALTALPPFTAAAARFVAAISLMWPVLLLSGRAERVRRGDWPLLIAAGLFQTTFYFALQYVGMQYTSASNTALIVNTRPIFVALLSAVLLHEALDWNRAAGIAVAFVGVALLTLGGAAGSFGFSAERALGDALIVLNAVSGAMGIVLLKKALVHYSPVVTAVYTTTIGTVGLIPLAVYETVSNGWPKGSALAWGAILYMAIVCTMIPYVLWYTALSRLKASETAVFLYLTPVVSVILSALLLDEPLTVWLLAGGALVILGASRAVGLLSSSDLRRPRSVD